MHFFASFLAGILLFFLSPFFPFTAGALSLIVVLVVLFRKRYWLMPVFVAGALFALFRHSPPPDYAPFWGRELVLGCVIEGLPRVLPSGNYLQEGKIISVMGEETGDAEKFLEGALISIISPTEFSRDVRYTMQVKIGRDTKGLNPGRISAERLYVFPGEIYAAEERESRNIFSGIEGKRYGLYRFMHEHFNGDTAALLSALTIGEQAEMSDPLREAYRVTGLTHLLSVSGTHFGLFTTLVFGIVRFLIKYLPYRILQRLTIYFTPSQAAALISLPFMVIYLLISGMSIPAVRSFIMINIFLLGLLAGRKGFWLNSLFAAAFLICLGEPSAILDLSFQLSFIAVLFIGIAVDDRDEEHRDKKLVERGGEILKGTLLLTVSVTAGTAPLIAYYFHSVSVISPFTNLLITPLMGFVLLPLSLAATFAYLISGYYPFQAFIAFLTDSMNSMVMSAAALPVTDAAISGFPVIVIVLLYGGIVLFLVMGYQGKTPGREGRFRSLAFVIIPLLTVLIIPLLHYLKEGEALTVTFLDVGQGDAIFVEGRRGETIAIDTGKTGRELNAYLRYRGKRGLDALVITHADGDHSAGLQQIIGKFRVREIWDNGTLDYREDILNGIIHRSLKRGDEVIAGDLRLLILHPYPGFYTFEDDEGTEENNASLVLKIFGENHSFLLTADIAAEAEEDLFSLGDWLRSDVLKVPHHGSRVSSTEQFLEGVSARIGVISVGRQNPYGHPHEETLERLQDVRIYRTDLDGAVRITEGPGGLSVKTYREFLFEEASDSRGELRNLRRLFTAW